MLGFAELDEGHARVVEFADGESLRKVLETGKPLPAPIAARIICDASTGAHYAHVAGNDDGTPLVHGDLRPETLLVGFNGVTKVTGYGALAFAPREMAGGGCKGRRVHSRRSRSSRAATSIGLSTDVYLLGLSLYECLTGSVPWAEQGDFFDHAVLTLPLPPPLPGLGAAERSSRSSRRPAPRRPATATPRHWPCARPSKPRSLGRWPRPKTLARYLETAFPQSSQLRTDRRRTIDAGLADFVRRQWAERPSVLAPDVVAVPPSEPPAPPAPAPLPPPAVPKGRPAAPLAVPRMPSPVAAQEDDEPQRDTGRSTRWLLALAVFVSLIAAWWAWKKSNESFSGRSPPRASASESAGRAGPQAIDAGGVAKNGPDASALVGLATGDADAGEATVASTATVDAGVEVATPAEVLVSLESSPPVDLLLEGKPLGRTPWSGRLPPGRKSFTLQNKDLGIAVVRLVTVKADPVTERFTFEKGAVSINAPEGAVIFIDSLRVGVAPIRGEVPIYEGSHRIVVTVGQSKWTDTFRVQPRQRVSFNVALQ